MKNKLVTGVKRFLREEEGTEVVEWALLAGLIVAVGAAIFFAIGEQVQVHLNSLLTALQTTPAGTQ